MDRIASSPKTEKLVGLEYDPDAVAEGNRKYGQPGKIGFFQSNVEAEDFEERLEEIVEQMDIREFNIINISMLLLHLKSPYRLLRIVRKYLARGGRIIVKDIDDGFNLVYPDDGGDFARVIDICNRNETSGYRHSGRQVYTLLRRAGYRDIVLEKAGLSTVGMNYEERDALFDTYFSFIREDLAIMAERYPHDKRVLQDYAWYTKNYEDLEERFQDETLFFNLGFVMFTASR
jgi:SAM-dependent methyltransferase